MTPLRGVWIDGGVLNNTPIHAFDENPPIINSGMLGIRLGRDPQYVTIESLLDFVKAVAGAIMSLGEVGQIRTEQERIQTIELPVENLDTLDFTPPLVVLEWSMVDTATAVLDYFGIKKKKSEVLKEFINLDLRSRDRCSGPTRSRGRPF